MSDEKILRSGGRIVTGAYEDYQSIRMRSMNRIRDVVRKVNEGIPLDVPEPKKEGEERERRFERKYQDANLPGTLTKMIREGKLSPKESLYLEKTMELVHQSLGLEAECKKLMMQYIRSEPLWTEFLVHIKGVGPVLSSSLLKMFGYCSRFDTVSKMWAYSGLSVNAGAAPRRKKGEKLGHNPAALTLAWKIGDSFIKQNTPIYRDIYDETRAKEEARTDENKPINTLHAHRRAMRKMTKIFWQHYWITGRTLAGLPVSEPYVVAVLGHPADHIITPEDVIAANKACRKPPKS